MKKVLLALAAAAAFSGSAYAADLPARMPLKAAPPPPLPIASWTGCYVGGGGGWGMWNDERTGIVGPPLVATRSQITDNIDFGGRGWFGTVQGGCDYQFGLGTQQFVIGAFADYDWADIHGKVIDVPVVWQSSKVGVGVFDANGVFTAVDTGTTIVTATSLGVSSGELPIQVV